MRAPDTFRRHVSMITLPPVVRAVLDAWDDAIVVLDVDRRVLYANAAAQRLLLEPRHGPLPEPQLMGRQLLTRAGRTQPIRYGDAVLGEVFFASSRPIRTLADQEDHAIHETLKRTRGNQAEAARRLGISRTTLWRRLRKDRESATTRPHPRGSRVRHTGTSHR
jgi:transcriptional regulator of acetoin/glycerol metabolism